MKRYNLSIEEEDKSNPTVETQNKILEAVRNSARPISITSLSKLAGTSYYQTRSSINFLYKLGIVDLIVSSGNSKFVILIKKEVKNEN